MDHLLEMIPAEANDAKTKDGRAIHKFLKGWNKIKHTVEPSFLTFMFQYSKYIHNKDLRHTREGLVQHVLKKLSNVEGVFAEHKAKFGDDYYKVNFDEYKEWELYEEQGQEEEEETLDFSSSTESDEN